MTFASYVSFFKKNNDIDLGSCHINLSPPCQYFRGKQIISPSSSPLQNRNGNKAIEKL